MKKLIIFLFSIAVSSVYSQTVTTFDVMPNGFLLDSMYYTNFPDSFQRIHVWGGDVVDSSVNTNKFSPAAFNWISGKFDKPSGTTSQYVRGDGSIATLPSIPSITPAMGDYDNYVNGTVYTNTLGVPFNSSQFATFNYSLVIGQAYMRVYQAPSALGPWTRIGSIGQTTLLTGLSFTREDTLTVNVKKDYCFYWTNEVSGAGNSIVKGTNTWMSPSK